MLDITSDATIGMNVDSATIDFGTLSNMSGYEYGYVTLTTNSVAGYTLVQTFNDAAPSEATRSNSSTDPARGTTRWMPLGKMLLNGTDKEHTIDVQLDIHGYSSFGIAKSNDYYTSTNMFYFLLEHQDLINKVAGTYTAKSNYSVTVNPVEQAPTVDRIYPTEHTIASGESTELWGSGFEYVYRIYLGDTDDAAHQCKMVYSSRNTAGTNMQCQLLDNIPAGDYDVHLLAQGGYDVVTPEKLSVVKKSTCTNASPESNCTVDIDSNMIPIRYADQQDDVFTPKWVVADTTKMGDWYNYTEKKWANAVTVKDPTKYTKDSSGHYTPGQVVSNADVLGYWVYVPQFKYKVLSVNYNTATEQNIDISFRARTSVLNPPEKWGDWATMPAFNFGDKQLSGFWMGKFETTGKIAAPTVKPNQVANVNHSVGEMFTAATSVGADDPVADQYGTGGQTHTSGHHLASLTSHMLRNSEWAAAAYLSASEFGAGVGNIRNNSISNTNGNVDADGDEVHAYNGAATGCGYNGNTDNSSGSPRADIKLVRQTKDDDSEIENPKVCEMTEDDDTRAYHQSNGVLASTTGNVYGIYDMAGGDWEYVMANYTTNADGSSTSGADSTANAIRPPYIDQFTVYSIDQCNWSKCGAQAITETRGWDGDISSFFGQDAPWLARGGNTNTGSYAGLFAFGSDNGIKHISNTYRITLIK